MEQYQALNRQLILKVTELKAESSNLREIVVSQKAEIMRISEESARFRKSVVEKFTKISETMQDLALEIFGETPGKSLEQEISKVRHSTVTNSMAMSTIHSPDRINNVNIRRRNSRCHSLGTIIPPAVATDELDVENMDLDGMQEWLKEENSRKTESEDENASSAKDFALNVNFERRSGRSRHPEKLSPVRPVHPAPLTKADRLSVRDMDVENSQDSLKTTSKEDQENEDPGDEQPLPLIEEHPLQEEEQPDEPCRRLMSTIAEENSKNVSSLQMSSHSSLVTVLKFASSTPHSNLASRETTQMEESPIAFPKKDEKDERCRLANISVRKKIFTNKSPDTKNSPCPVPLEPSVNTTEAASKSKPKKKYKRVKLADKTNIVQDPDYPIPIKVENLEDIPMTRPKRKAAPTNLKEPDVNTKLRRH